MPWLRGARACHVAERHACVRFTILKSRCCAHACAVLCQMDVYMPPVAGEGRQEFARVVAQPCCPHADGASRAHVITSLNPRLARVRCVVTPCCHGLGVSWCCGSRERRGKPRNVVYGLLLAVPSHRHVRMLCASDVSYVLDVYVCVLQRGVAAEAPV